MQTLSHRQENAVQATPFVPEKQQARSLLRAFIALRHRNFRLFWFGQLVSLIGTWMQSIGQSWLVLELTHSALLLGLVGALQFLPVLLFSAYHRGCWSNFAVWHQLQRCSAALRK